MLMNFWPQVTQLYPLLGGSGSLVAPGEGFIGELGGCTNKALWLYL